MPQKLTHDIILAAIEGFQGQKNSIDSQIAELRSILDGGGHSETADSPATAKPRKKRSAAVRKRMAMAQRARYAKLKQSSEEPQTETAKPKRAPLSTAARKRIAAAQRKRWALKKAGAKQAA
jgi:hypothetical protein